MMTGERDKYVDGLRVLSVASIVFGHWFSATASWDPGRVWVGNILSSIPLFWPASWVFMAVPVVLFVGGFSNFVALSRYGNGSRGYRGFYVRRLRRLLRPVMFFLGFWLIVEFMAHLLSVGGDHLVRLVYTGGAGPFGPLWFIIVYLAAVIMSPGLVWLHRRYRIAIPAALAAGCVGVDLLRFVGHVPLVGWLNLALAWLLPHQLGFFYADGSFSRASRRLLASMCVAGLLGLVVGSSTGAYSPTIGYVRGLGPSNINPPTAMILMLSIWQVGLVLLCRRWITAALGVPRVEYSVVKLNGVIMSVYLWHMTALLLVLLMLLPIGLANSEPPLSGWWYQRPIWLVLGVAVLAVIIKLVAWVERGEGKGDWVFSMVD
jgi:peptidoglycan/LPS O-acetylase OafA/YrhL